MDHALVRELAHTDPSACRPAGHAHRNGWNYRRFATPDATTVITATRTRGDGSTELGGLLYQTRIGDHTVETVWTNGETRIRLETNSRHDVVAVWPSKLMHPATQMALGRLAAALCAQQATQPN